MPAMGQTMKRCSRCRELLPLVSFNRLTRASDGRQSYCRACNAAWHAENRSRHNGMIRERNERVIAQLHRRLFEYKLERGCADCDEHDPTVLEFDHVAGKTAAVSSLVKNSAGWDRILAELDRCEVVCANCHRRRMARRAGDQRWRLFIEHRRLVEECDPEGPRDELVDLAKARARSLVTVSRPRLELGTTTG